MTDFSISVYDYSGVKLCDMYDSSVESDGQAYDITLRLELNGWKELDFSLPKLVNGDYNFRWDYVKSEYKVRLKMGDTEDWYIIQGPTSKHDGRSISNTVSCGHVSSNLKTKNLYMVLDDENGIGTIQYLIDKVLTGTEWTLGEYDTMLERDGVTEKIRSVKSDGKDGSYKLITTICDLFNAYPVFDGANKTVSVYALNSKKPRGK